MNNPLKTAKDIAESYANLARKELGFTDPKTENMAIDRYAICKQCPKLTVRSTCALCGCYMPAKVRGVNTQCPANKW